MSNVFVHTQASIIAHTIMDTGIQHIHVRDRPDRVIIHLNARSCLLTILRLVQLYDSYTFARGSVSTLGAWIVSLIINYTTKRIMLSTLFQLSIEYKYNYINDVYYIGTTRGRKTCFFKVKRFVISCHTPIRCT